MGVVIYRRVGGRVIPIRTNKDDPGNNKLKLGGALTGAGVVAIKAGQKAAVIGSATNKLNNAARKHFVNASKIISSTKAALQHDANFRTTKLFADHAHATQSNLNKGVALRNAAVIASKIGKYSRSLKMIGTGVGSVGLGLGLAGLHQNRKHQQKQIKK